MKMLQEKLKVLTLSLNGESMQCAPIENVAQLLQQQGYESQKIAVAINGDFVPRSQYENTSVNNGDQIDIIQAVGGG